MGEETVVIHQILQEEWVEMVDAVKMIHLKLNVQQEHVYQHHVLAIAIRVHGLVQWTVYLVTAI